MISALDSVTLAEVSGDGQTRGDAAT